MKTRQPSATTPAKAIGRADRSSPLRITSFGMFVAAFLFMLGAVAGVAIAQFLAKPLAPWISIGYSGGAVLCTWVALAMRPRR